MENRHSMKKQNITKDKRVDLHSLICARNMVFHMQSGQPIPSMSIGVVSLQSKLKILLCCLFKNLK